VPLQFKIGTAVTYRYPSGKTVKGTILGRYANDQPDLYLCELIDDRVGKIRRACHRDDITVAVIRRPRRLGNL